ncbi:MAG: hypothetical protein JWQ53_2061 [Klenkia sp.]|nr:hypothetical protein [Klenkia sp.]
MTPGGPRTPGFALFWAASTVSTFGSWVTTVAVGVLGWRPPFRRAVEVPAA